MTARGASSDRVLLPRWRPWRLALARGEGVPARGASIDMATVPGHGVALQAWRTSPGRARAGELVSSALTRLDFGDGAMTAATDLLADKNSNDVQRVLAAGLLDSPPDLDTERGLPYDGEASIIAMMRVKETRARLRRNPRIPLAWMDLAREYWVLGAEAKASRALSTAVALASGNRLVLRAAVLFYVATQDVDRAVGLIGKGTADTDPWIAAARVGLLHSGANVGGIREARRLLEDESFAPWHLGELAAGIGTLEFVHGNDRRARQLMRRALLDPTENVAAHAEWARGRGLDPVDVEPSRVSHAWEADARRKGAVGDWENAARSSLRWLADQPFSLDAATSASYYATEAGDFRLAEAIISSALRTSPADASLLNNRAFARACAWDLVGALSDIRPVLHAVTEPSVLGCVLATSGLICLRAGEPERGREFYERSIRIFLKAGLADSAARAAVNLASEEVRVRSAGQVGALKRASQLVERSSDPGVRLAWRRLVEEGHPSVGDLARPQRARETTLDLGALK